MYENMEWDPQTLVFNIREPRLQFTRNNFTFRACSQWNEIPSHIKDIKNISNFKKQMKSWVKDRRPRIPD